MAEGSFHPIGPRLSVEGGPEFQRDMEAAGRTAEDSLNRMERSGRALTTGLQTLGLGFAAAAGGMVLLGQRAFETATALKASSEAAGVSVEGLQVYRRAALDSSVAAGTLDQALGRLTSRIGEAATGGDQAIAGFEALGIGVLDVQGKVRTTESVLEELSDRLRRIDDPARRAALATGVLGQELASKLMPFLLQGAEGFQKFRDELERTGALVSTEAAERFDAFDSKLKVLQNRFAALGVTIAEKFLPYAERALALFEKIEAGPSLEQRMQDLALGIDPQLKELLYLERQMADDPGFDASARIRELRQEIGPVLAEIERLKIARAEALAPSSELPAPRRSGDRNPEGNRRLAQLKRDAEATVKVIEDLERKLGAVTDPRGAAIEGALSKLPASASEEQRAQVALYTAALYDQTEGLKAATQAANDYVDAQLEIAKQAGEVILAEQRVQAERDGELERIRELIATEDEQRAALQAKIALYREWGLTAEEAQRALEKLDPAAKENAKTARELGLSFSSALEDAIVRGDKLGDVVKGLGQDIIRVFTRRTITEPLVKGLDDVLKKLFEIREASNGIGGGGGGGGGGFLGSILGAAGSLFGGGFSLTGGGYSGIGDIASVGFTGAGSFAGLFAKGGLFDAGEIVPFASGGILDRPMTFPLSRGRTGLAGEAGPEAILPLRRGPGGRLGVDAGAAAGPRIVVQARLDGGTSPEAVQELYRMVRKLDAELEVRGANAAVTDRHQNPGRWNL